MPAADGSPEKVALETVTPDPKMALAISSAVTAVLMFNSVAMGIVATLSEGQTGREAERQRGREAERQRGKSASGCWAGNQRKAPRDAIRGQAGAAGTRA